MSTRANIKVVDGNDWGKPFWFYRHSDGYPEGALPLIKKFCDWVSEGKIRDNVGQASGWLVLLGAKEYDHYHGFDENDDYFSKPKEDLFSPREEDRFGGWKCGAIEPTYGKHGDIEFLYTIDLGNRELTVDALCGEEKSITVKFDDIDIERIRKEFLFDDE